MLSENRFDFDGPMAFTFGSVQTAGPGTLFAKLRLPRGAGLTEDRGDDGIGDGYTMVCLRCVWRKSLKANQMILLFGNLK